MKVKKKIKEKYQMVNKWKRKKKRNEKKKYIKKSKERKKKSDWKMLVVTDNEWFQLKPVIVRSLILLIWFFRFCKFQKVRNKMLIMSRINSLSSEKMKQKK